MAHLWKMEDEGGWVATPVGDAFALLDDAAHLVEAGHSAAALIEHASLRRLANPPETWALLCAPQSDVRLNGLPVPLGLAVLADRDELRIPGHLVRFFSTESLAHVEACPDTTADSFCPRCKQAIEHGSAAVRCPGCGLWHHASDDLPCWSYAPTCAGCSQDTALNAGFRWTPEEL